MRLVIVSDALTYSFCTNWGIYCIFCSFIFSTFMIHVWLKYFLSLRLTSNPGWTSLESRQIYYDNVQKDSVDEINIVSWKINVAVFKTRSFLLRAHLSPEYWSMKFWNNSWKLIYKDISSWNLQGMLNLWVSTCNWYFDFLINCHHCLKPHSLIWFLFLVWV